MKKILITGGAGFIGANLARRLVAEGGFNVYIIEKKTTNLWRIKDVLSKVTLVYVDLKNRNSTIKAINIIKPNVVFHLASYGVYPVTQTDAKSMIDGNVLTTLHVVDSLKGLRSTLLINAGSCAEYQEKKSNISETDPVDPKTPYAITKLAAELLLQTMTQEYRVPVINLRLFTPYGYFEDNQRLIPHVILRALENKTAELSSPNYVRDFIFIEDLVDIFLQILYTNKKYYGEIFNIASGKQHSIKEVVATVEKVLGKKIKTAYGKKVSHYQEPEFFQADIAKAKGEFSWNPRHSFEAGITKTIDWFLKNKHLYS
jgi:nucleoside-diphosphate-sugar epimerase